MYFEPTFHVTTSWWTREKSEFICTQNSETHWDRNNVQMTSYN